MYAAGRRLRDDGQSIVFGNGQPEPPGTFVLSGVFVRNVQTGAATRVDLTPAGAPGDGISYPGIISGDGRYVAFNSDARDLTVGENDTSNFGPNNVFVRDLVSSTTTLVSVNDLGTGVAAGESDLLYMTPNGRDVVFVSSARDLVPNDTNTGEQIYERDLVSGTTMLVSTGLAAGSTVTTNIAVSDDGNSIAFEVLEPTTFRHNIYLRNVSTGTTTLVSADEVR